MTETVLDRLLRYVVIDTQSDPESRTQPSTEKQKDLGRVLVDELLALGLGDAHMDEHGNVYATLPANTNKDVPVICFCSHMDTAPDFTGTNVRPNVVRNYQGGDIQLQRRQQPHHQGLRASRPQSSRSATTSSPPTAPPFWVPMTRPASPRS
jgi:tripeptide aminopeptidase